MKLTWSWARRRFWEFRVADAIYLRYFVSFFQFIIVTYALYIEGAPLFGAVFTSMKIYAMAFFFVYIPTGVIIGHFFHRKKQYPTEVEITTLQNPFLWKATPGKEKQVSWPTEILRLKMEMKLWEKFGLLTPEVTEQCEKLLAKMEELVEGKTLN